MNRTVALSPDTVSVLADLKQPEESLEDVIRRLAVGRRPPRAPLEDDESAVC